MEPFGTVVRRHREARSWSLARLARDTEISEGYLSKVETGSIQSPGIETARKIVNVLRIPCGELFEVYAGPQAEAPKDLEDSTSFLFIDRQLSASMLEDVRALSRLQQQRVARELAALAALLHRSLEEPPETAAS